MRLSDMTRLLDLVLPSDGFRCHVAINSRVTNQGGKHPAKTTWYDTNEQLAQAATEWDDRGWDSYYATATYQDKSARKATNVKALQSFRLDVDVGEKKSYADIRSAVSAVWRFARDHMGAQPTLVRSGSGVHAYWALTAPLDSVAWKNGAAALDARAFGAGLLIDDRGVTIDAARILRLPGTHNFKTDPPMPVQVLQWGEQTDFSKLPLGGGLNALPTFQRLAVPTTPEMRIAVSTKPADFFGTIAAHDPAYAAPIGEQCVQMREMRASHGLVSEPLWYALLGVLGHCEDGVQYGLEWSNGHPGYSEAATTAKLHQARTASGPSTCNRLETINPSGCNLCIHRGRIVSPIQLGRNAPAPESALPSELPPLPWGFKWSMTGQLLAAMPQPTIEEGETPEPIAPIVISEHPIYLSGISNTETAERMVMVFKLRIPGRGWRQIVIPASVAFGRDLLRKTLADQHAVFHTKAFPHFERFIIASIVDMQKKGSYDVVYDQFGFKPARERDPHKLTGFIVGQDLIGTDGSLTTTQLNDALTVPARYLQPRGALNIWSAAAGRLCQPGMEGITFSLLASFASPLMIFAGDWGGAIIHGTNTKSGSGKGFILNAISSVWGDLMATRLDDHDTMNSKFIKISQLCNLPVCYEELRERDPEIVQKYVMIHTTGKDRARGRAGGGLVELENTWCNIMFSVSNMSLADLLGAGTVQDAPAMRVFEYVNTSAFSNAEATQLGRTLTDNRGTAGRAFMATVMKNVPVVAQMVERQLQYYEQRLKASTEHRFWLRLLATIDVAGRIVERCGILEIGVDRIMNWAVGEVAQLIEHKATSASTPTEALGAFLAENVRHTLVCDTAWRPAHTCMIQRAPSAECQIRLNSVERRLYISMAFIRRWSIANSIPFRQFEMDLKKLSILIRSKSKMTLTAGTQMAGGQIMCWELNADAVAGLPILVEGQPDAQDRVVPIHRPSEPFAGRSH